MREGRGAAALLVCQRQRGWEGGGAKVSQRREVEGCAGRVVKDEGVRERQHLDPELFPSQVTFV